MKKRFTEFLLFMRMHFVLVVESFATFHAHEGEGVRVNELVDFEFVESWKRFVANITGKFRRIKI